MEIFWKLKIVGISCSYSAFMSQILFGIFFYMSVLSHFAIQRGFPLYTPNNQLSCSFSVSTQSPSHSVLASSLVTVILCQCHGPWSQVDVPTFKGESFSTSPAMRQSSLDERKLRMLDFARRRYSGKRCL